MQEQTSTLLLSIIFGAKGQFVFGVLCSLAGLVMWAYWSFLSQPNVRAVFHVSMFFGVIACYSIIATSLGHRETERVKEIVIEQADDVDVDINVN